MSSIVWYTVNRTVNKFVLKPPSLKPVLNLGVGMSLFIVNFLVAGLVLILFWVISKSVSWLEALTQFGIQTILILLVCLGVKNSRLSDVEIVSGRIVSKQSEKVHCRHSYQCNCVTRCTGTGKSRSCHRVCQTCYEHSYDVDWFADTNINRRVYIDTVDRRGTTEPPRWTKIRIGEPASFSHRYENYIKADPDSLFQHHMEEEEIAKYPRYPGSIYDYYRINRSVGVFDLREELSEINADIGPAVGGNLVVVTDNKSTSKYAKLIQRAWLGAKKNDIVLVLGLDGKRIKWAEVVGISYPDFKVKLRNEVNDHGILDQGLLDKVKVSIIRDFKRRPMSEFEYLKESYKPTKGEWVFSLIMSLILSIGMGIFFHINDPFVRGFTYKRHRRWR